MCLTVTWTLLTIDRKVVTQELVENSPRLSLSLAWTHGQLPVSTWVCLDSIMLGEKCLTAIPIHSASTSHGNHVTWCFLCLTLKNPARCNFQSLIMYKVAVIPCSITEESVIIHKKSLGLGMVITLLSRRLSCAALKALWSSSVHVIFSLGCLPATALSSGSSKSV